MYLSFQVFLRKKKKDLVESSILFYDGKVLLNLLLDLVKESLGREGLKDSVSVNLCICGSLKHVSERKSLKIVLKLYVLYVLGVRVKLRFQ